MPTSTTVQPVTLASPRPDRGEVRVLVLGSTGSIGTQTLEVIEHLNAEHAAGRSDRRYRVVGLASGNNQELIQTQARRLGCDRVALARRDGPDAAECLVREVECDVVLAAMVGSAGLPATLAAVELGRDVALANKETLVAAGGLIVPAARRSGARLLPVDSEHSAIWQCLLSRGSAAVSAELPVPPMVCGADIARLVLTASGGPFRTLSREQAYDVPLERALKHPTWSMGAKVTIDSASLTNKALEIIEAHWLFGLPGERIDAVIHPQSIVHSFVEFADASVVAQLGTPDMRTPIQYALTFPRRPAGVSRKLDLLNLGSLEFTPADRARWLPLDLAYRVIASGGTAGAVFNAASEEATTLFLQGAGVKFGMIPELARAALDELGVGEARCLGDVLEADARARALVRQRTGR